MEWESPLALDERQQFVTESRRAAERTRISFESLMAAGVPEELAIRCVAQSWTPVATHDMSWLAKAMEKQARIMRGDDE